MVHKKQQLFFSLDIHPSCNMHEHQLWFLNQAYSFKCDDDTDQWMADIAKMVENMTDLSRVSEIKYRFNVWYKILDFDRVDNNCDVLHVDGMCCVLM